MRRVLAVVVLALATMMFGATQATAHALLVSSSPADGSDLPTAPDIITLTFDEQVLPASATMSLYSAQGVLLAQSGARARPLVVVGGPDAAPAARLTVTLPRLGPGGFALDWQVQSADDLHRTAGSIVFGIAQVVAPSTSARTAPWPATGSVLLRWVDLALLALLLGAVILVVGALPRAAMAPADRARWLEAGRRIVHLSAGAAVILAVAVVVDLAGGVGFVGQIVFATPFGRLWVVHLAGLIGIFLLSGRTSVRSRRLLGLMAVLAVVMGFAAGSHVGTGADRPVAAALLAAHLTAGCGWAGAVVLLAASAIIPRFRGQAVAMLRTFAIPAALCVALVVTTGIALGARQVANADALVTSNYGRILLVKLGLVAVAALLGMITYLEIRSVKDASRSLGRSGLVRRAALEGCALLMVLGAAAALSLTSPPRGPAVLPTHPTDQPHLVAQVDGLLLTLDLSPGGIGNNWVRVTVDDTRRPERAPVTGVTVALSGPEGQAVPALALVRVGNSDRWQLGDVRIAQAGGWRVALAVHRVGLVDTSWQPSYNVGSPPSGAPDQGVGNQPWAGLLDELAVLVGLCCFAGAAGVAVYHRRRHSSTNARDRQSAKNEMVS